MKLKSLAVCLFVALIATGCQVERQEGNNLIEELGNKHHIFRQGEYEGAIDLDSEIYRKINQDQNILWELVFHNGTEFNFEKKDPKLGWKWSLFPVEDLSTYEKEGIEYSRDQKKLVLSPAGTVIGHKEWKINLSLIYIPLMFLLAVGFYINSVDLEWDNPRKIYKDKTTKYLNPTFLYLTIILQYYILFLLFTLGIKIYLCLLMFILFLVVVALFGFLVSDVALMIFSVFLSVFLFMDLITYVAPTKDTIFLNQYIFFLAVASFIAYFLGQIITKKIAARKKAKIEEMEEREKYCSK
ncbi:MAG TPA: hypothetical protein VKO42_04920 [Patescibacteria group bacterium]|nr:hypothetical protein [Patescibacteria group bacterium]